MTKKGVAIASPGAIHHIEHLSVISLLMDIPFVLFDFIDYELTKKYYPQIHVLFVGYEDFTPEYLVSNYDVIFMSEFWKRQGFLKKYQFLEEKYQKQLRKVYCPHGFSDKGYALAECVYEDILLVYGQNMIDQLAHYMPDQKPNSIVVTGNCRSVYYKQHQDFFDHIVEKEVFSRFDHPRPTILYAPTWLDAETSGTFFEAFPYVLDQLPSDYNLIVKLHPRLDSNTELSLYYYILGKYEDRKNIIFLKEFPLIYPLLTRCDIYIGDMSSIGYDFLAFNKPMFFLKKNSQDAATDRRLYLYRCGTAIPMEQLQNLYSIIDRTLPIDQERFTQKRKEVYSYTFGEEKPFAEIKKEILKSYESEWRE